MSNNSLQIVNNTYAVSTSSAGTANVTIPLGSSLNGSVAPVFLKVYNASNAAVQLNASIDPGATFPTALPVTGTPQPGMTIIPAWSDVIEISLLNQPVANAYVGIYASAAATVYVTQVHY